MSGLLCVTGTRGAPGASTLAVALAYTAPVDDRVVVVDADPDGGSLAATLGLAASPGLVSLAAATRHGFNLADLVGSLQLASPRFDLLAAPSSPEQVTSVLRQLGDAWPSLLSGSSAVADVGRWRPDSPARSLVDAATVTVLLVDPSVSGVAHARAAFEDLSSRCDQVVVAARGSKPYPPEDVAATLGVESVWEVRTDRPSAGAIGAVTAGRWPRRNVLARDAAALHSVAEWWSEQVPA